MEKQITYMTVKDYADKFGITVQTVYNKIKNKELEVSKVNLMLDNMITIFQETEDYEKCHVCLQIKTGVNDRI